VAEPEALRVAFFKGQDSTHSSRDLPLGFGTRCWDIDLRSGIYEPRPGPARFKDIVEGNVTPWLSLGRYAPLFLAVDLPSGRTSLLIVEPEAEGEVTYNAPVFYKAVHFENEPGDTSPAENNPWFSDRVVVRSRVAGNPLLACQITESCEAAAYGNKLYVCNLSDPRWSYLATVEIDLRDLKGSWENISTWPKARHICMSPDGYPVFLDVYARGPLSVETSDQPLSATGEPTFGSNYDEIPGGAGDRNMRGIFHQNGLFIFQKRSVFVLWGPPPEWDHELVLNSIGTLSPSSVVSIGQYIYFLGNDGIVKRMTGEKGVVENVGAYTPDGRSPIENALRDYHTKPSGEVGEVIYGDRVSWAGCATQDNVDISEDGVKMAALTPVLAENQQDEDQGLYVPGPDDGVDCWQTLATDGADPTWGNGYLINSIKVMLGRNPLDPQDGWGAKLTVAYDDAGKSDDVLDVLGEVNKIFSIGGTNPDWIEFMFDEPVLIEQALGSPVTVRVMLKKTTVPAGSTDGSLYWHYKISGSYARGRFVLSAGSDATFMAYFTGYGTDLQGIIGNTDTVTDAAWKIGSIVDTLPDGTGVQLQCYLNRGGWLDVDDGGALLTEYGSSTVVWRLVLTSTKMAYTPLVGALLLSYYVGRNAGDEPFAVDWDGRYCLSLLRRDSYWRDLFVWDNEAWSIWRAPSPLVSSDNGAGFWRLAVMPDTRNRQRLVFIDIEKLGAETYATVNCLLKDYAYCQLPQGWRMPTPQFISREMMIAGGLAGKIKQSFLRCTDLGMTGRLWMGLSFDGMAWANGPDYLSRDMVIPPGVLNHEHLFTERPWPGEGRFCQVFVGYLDEIPHRSGGGIVNALVCVQDWLLTTRAIGFRENFHSGGTDA